MLRALVIIFSLLLLSCSKKLHIAELATYQLSELDTVQLLMEKRIIKSTSYKHNIFPLHTVKLKNKIISQVSDKNFKAGNTTFSFDSYFLGMLFIIKAKVNDKAYFDISLNYPKLFTYQRIYKVYLYFDQYFGVYHSEGFTLFKENKFCKTYITNPNGRFHTAIIKSSDGKKSIVVTSRGPITRVDIPIEEWKVIPLSKDC